MNSDNIDDIQSKNHVKDMIFELNALLIATGETLKLIRKKPDI